MGPNKIFLFAAVGVAAVLLLTSDKAKELRNDAEDNAKKWKKKFYKLAGSTADSVTDLKDIIGSEIEGLGDDARERIMTILNESGKSGKRIKKNISGQLS